MDFPKFTMPPSIDNIISNPHGERMLASLVVLNMPGTKEWGPLFVERCHENVGREFFCDTKTRVSPVDFLNRGWMSAKELSTRAIDLVALPAWNSECAGLKPIDLANPLLSGDLIVELMSSLDSENPNPGQAALYANPNNPASIDRALRKLPRGYIPFYLCALAKHGNIQDPKVELYVKQQIIEFDDGLLSATQLTQAQQALAMRKDLTPTLAESLDAKCAPSVFYKLVGNEMHQSLVLADKLPGHNFLNLRGEPVSLSPALTRERIQELWTWSESGATSTHPSGQEFQAELAAHENSTPEMMDQALNEPDIKFLYAPRIAYSKKPAEAINKDIKSLLEARLIDGSIIGSIPGASSENLFTAAEKYARETTTDRDHNLEALCTHPNFPWERITPKTHLHTVSGESAPLLACSKALNSKVTPTVTEGAEVSLLFVPTLSGYRLSALAKEHPDLTALAALHPNGWDISVKHLPERAIVENIRGKSALAGRSEATIGGKARTLEI